MTGALVFLLSAVTCGVCAQLLARMYRRSGARLLLWSSLSFVLWTITNVLVFLDLTVLPNLDLQVLRSATGAAATVLLLFGLIWESE